MDPFQLMCGHRPIPVVKSSNPRTELDFDEGLIDKILGTPDKIQIPERYIPEREPQRGPEEEKKRSQKAEAICRLLSKSNGGAAPLVLPRRGVPTPFIGGSPQGVLLQAKANLTPNGYSRPNGISHTHTHSSSSTSTTNSNGSSSSSSNNSNGIMGPHHLPQLKGLIHPSSLPSSPVRKVISVKKNAAVVALKRRPPSAGSASSLCDWSLAGVLPPSPLSTWSRDSGAPSSSSLSASERLFGAAVPPAFGIGDHSPIPYEKGVVIGGSKVDYLKASVHSQPSSSSSSSGRSSASADREDLLHLQHYLAREVTEKSRIVAIRALANSPNNHHSLAHRYRDPSPPSPVELPTVQQREGFFT